MKFSDVIGQDVSVDILRKAFVNEKYSQAYLFTGPEGVGKRRTAFAFAQILNCRELSMDFNGKIIDACDECDSCRKIKDSNHPDVELITVEEKHKEIRIDQIHELQKRIALKSMEGRKKVYILDDANQMNRDSSNCLLKTLEEPNEDVVIILIARNLYGLLPTVRSRCQILKFKTIPQNKIKGILTEKYNVDDDRASFIAELSQGRLGVAEQYAGEEMEHVLELSMQIVEGVLQQKGRKEFPNYEKIFKFTDEICRDKGDTLNLLNCLAVSLRRHFVKNPTNDLHKKIETVLNTQNLIMRNINMKTAVNDMMINLSGH